jgi:FkbM family methyltransferase
MNHLHSLVINSNDPDVDPFDLVRDHVQIHNHADADQIIVLDFFAGRVPGKFLIVGAHDGLDHSRRLLELGWQGVYCEPNPAICAQLIDNTRDYASKVTILNVAITPTGGPVTFYIDAQQSQWCTVVDSWRTSTQQGRTLITNSMTFEQLLDLVGRDFDYVQTDVEGLDIPIIQTVDWSRLDQCQLICTEAGPAVLKQLCKQAGFMITDQTQTNSIYKKHG